MCPIQVTNSECLGLNDRENYETSSKRKYCVIVTDMPMYFNSEMNLSNVTVDKDNEG